MPIEVQTATKIERISIRNYKGIDSVEINFPKSRYEGEPEILILGSQNGLGKTSIIECCAMLLHESLGANMSPELRHGKMRRLTNEDGFGVTEHMIMSGHNQAIINGDLKNKVKKNIELKVSSKGFAINVNVGKEKKSNSDAIPYHFIEEKLTELIFRIDINPIVNENFLLFNSFRMNKLGGLELDNIFGQSRIGKYELRTLDTFKLIILRALMQKAKLFEHDVHDDSADEVIQTLNKLLKVYAGGEIQKLCPLPKNTIDFRISTEIGGNSISFDGLGSGQQQIISTLFLIWYNTNKDPKVVLIDGPELHLNAHWHKEFINNMISLAPHNQYIIATHSTDIMDSVPERHRLLLSKN